MPYHWKKPHRLLIAATVLLPPLGFAGGWIARDLWNRDPVDGRGVEIREGGYRFINPLLECETGQEMIGGREIRPFRHRVERYAAVLMARGSASHVSVYFRDLNNGPWFGINEREVYSPASMLKVATLIACLKQAESDRNFLRRRIRFTSGAEDANRYENIVPSVTIKQGKTYTVDDLLSMMIIHSDNNAMHLLLSVMDAGVIAKTYSDLGITLPEVPDQEDFLSLKQYASCYRILFNASYLNREMSEKALGLLSRTEFQQGIIAGVPRGVPVSHKFGERVLGQSREVKQLHDCGIIYYPNSPYLLCVMTRGPSFAALNGSIREISRMVFEEVDRHHRIQEGKR